MSTSMTHANGIRTGYGALAIQKVAAVIGVVFLIVGIAGFIPGLTSNIGSMMFAGHHSEAMLLGLFQVSVLHNIVHILYGIAGLAFAASARASRQYLIWGGVIYAVLWLYGLIFMGNMPANFVPLNSWDNWLHLVLAIGMILLGVFVNRRELAKRA